MKGENGVGDVPATKAKTISKGHQAVHHLIENVIIDLVIDREGEWLVRTQEQDNLITVHHNLQGRLQVLVNVYPE